MKRFSCVFAIAIMALAAIMLAAQDQAGSLTPVRNARFVYVTSFSGSEVSSNPLPEDRRAINNVQAALGRMGPYTIVYSPQQADMIVAVQSRPTEDILAVYDRHSWREGNFLWREFAPSGLATSDAPLIKRLEAALGTSLHTDESPR